MQKTGATSPPPARGRRLVRHALARANVEGARERDEKDFEALKKALLGPELGRLSPEALGKALPEATVESQKQGDGLSWALRPAVMAALHDAVRNDPHVFVDAFAPAMGPAIRKAVSHALRSLVQQLNETLAHGLSLRGLRWRLEAARTGRPFAEIVLLRSLVYRVEQVFLVHRETGLVLHHLVAPGSPPQDPDQVAAMLSAIDAFVHDAFREEARLARFHVGELVGWVEHGPLAVLVAVVRGTAPDGYGDLMREVQERIHLQFRQDLSSFRGEVDLFVKTESLLLRCLQSEAAKASTPARKRLHAAALVALLAALAVAVAWGQLRARAEERRFAGYASALGGEPGIVLTSARRTPSGYAFEGLRDPLAPPPESVLEPLGAPKGASFSFAPFLSLDPRLTERRAARLLAPPPGASISLAGDAVVARGRAPHGWIEAARTLAPTLPGVRRLDAGGLVDDDADRELEAAAASLAEAVVLFPLNSAEFGEGQRRAVEGMARDVARMQKAAPGAKKRFALTVAGHADARGAEAHNQALSGKRAERVLEELADLGVDRGLMLARGAGVAPSPDEETCLKGRKSGPACARRVDVRVELMPW